MKRIQPAPLRIDRLCQPVFGAAASSILYNSLIIVIQQLIMHMERHNGRYNSRNTGYDAAEPEAYTAYIGTAGTFLKAYDIGNGRKVCCRLSDFDPNREAAGRECVNELIAERLLELLNVGGKIFNTWPAASFDFKRTGEDKIPIEIYYSNNSYQGGPVFDFCLLMRWGKDIYEILACDFLIPNRDSRGANMDVPRNRRTGKVRPTPLFDNGLSLVFSRKNAIALIKFDVLEDKRIQSFAGGNSANENTELIPRDEMPELQGRHREKLFKGLENVIGVLWLDKI